MEETGEGPDTTSIKPTSSLRAKFENLGKDKDVPPSTPVVPRPPVGNGTSARNGRPSSEGERRNVEGRTSIRPSSMNTTHATQPSPPVVTVNSPPRPPTKNISLDLRTFIGASPLSPITPDRTGDAASKTSSRNASRVGTPGIEAHKSSPYPAPDPNKSATSSPPHIPLQTKPATKPLPPAVNRAAKPQVPSKPAGFAKTPGGLSAPEASADASDRSASPFSTPPSSGASSPAPRRNSYTKAAGLAQGTGLGSSVNRVRADSDASWVQRIRGESDASLHERERAGSNASFVEPSLLPDNWLPQPRQQTAASRLDPEHPGLAKAGTMPLPARYRPSTGRGNKPVTPIAEDMPRLPARPELQFRSGRISPTKARSGRTSPLKAHMLPPRRSVDGLRKAAVTDAEPPPRIPAVRLSLNTRTVPTQAFDRSSMTASSATPTGPPAVPAPRRSIDRRREPPPPPSAAILPGNVPSYEDREDYTQSTDQSPALSDYPDGTKSNRRPPRFKQRPWQIPTEYDTRLFAICGDFVCTTGYITKVWNIRTGAQLLHMEHRENTKMTSIVFKPSPNIEHEGTRIWLGTNAGDIHEIDIDAHSIVKTKAGVHSRREVTRMFRYASELWTLDDGGELYVWRPDHKGMPSLDSQYNNWRIPKGHTFCIAVGKQLWVAYGKELRVFAPSAHSDTEFQLTRAPLSQTGTSDVTSGATLNHKQDLIYFGHADGKVSIYNRNDFTCQAVVNVSVYRIVCLAGVGEYLWAGYSTGMAYVYDTSAMPWIARKDWKAHDKQICSIVADPSAMWKMGRLNVVTLGLDNLLRIWDGMLQEDWIDTRMDTRDSEFCTFRELSVDVLTWNAGACKPSYTQHSTEDSTFFRDFMRARNPPDILVFGFQELVDLENKKVTAKSFFKSKRKDPDEQQHMSRQYRAWRDHLGKCIDENMPTDTTYTLLHTASMVGLFTCVFVKSSERPRIRYVHTSEVKRGMGGIHGNKGAIIVRMVLDDSSICLINCHLAAGQTQTMHRNNDIAEILETNALPPYPLNEGEAATHRDIFPTGGDGSMVMDHEICILNGDLNYRIDTMGRDSVIKHIQQGNLARLLERDQLLLSRRKNPGFRLRAFQESPITFAPTYKYNVHSDEYDTSEKRRSPAWCDRILYRGLGKVKMDEYKRWDQIRISDHRPVSGRLRIRVKTVDADKREIVWDKCMREFDGVRQRIAKAAQFEYLMHVLGLSKHEATAALAGQVR